MKTVNYSPHIFALFTLFVGGNAIITLPFFYANNPFICFGVATIVALAFVLFFNFVINLSLKSCSAFIIIGSLISLLAIYSAAITLYDYLGFVVDIQLPQTTMLLLWLTTVLTLTVFAVSSNSALYKYCLLVAVFSVGMVFFMLCGGIKHFDISQTNFILSKDSSFSDVAKIFLRCFSSVAVAILFVALTKGKNTSAIGFGTTCGFLLIGACLAQSIFTLGATPLSYPYLKAISVISSGSLFTRYDGFVFYVFFSCAITKAAVCIKTVILFIKSIKLPFYQLT